jgi:hypothetical protein
MREYVLQKTGISATLEKLFSRYSGKKLFSVRSFKYKFRRMYKKKTERFKLRALIALLIFYGIDRNSYVFANTLKKVIGLSEKRGKYWYDVHDDTFLYRFLNELTKSGWIEKIEITPQLRKELSKVELQADGTFCKRVIKSKFAYRFKDIEKYKPLAEEYLKNEKSASAAERFTLNQIKYLPPLLDLILMYGEEFLTLLKKVLELVYQHKAMLISKAEEREKYMQQVAMFLNNLSKRGELSRLEKRIPAYKRKFYRYIKKLSESMNLQKNTKPQVT